MADEKNVTQYISFQQGVNLGDNIVVPSGASVQAGGSGKGFSRMMQVHEMKKQAEAEGLTLAQYLAKIREETAEAEQAMADDDNIVRVDSEGKSQVVDAEADDKRKQLESSNTIFKRAINNSKVDLLAIYNLINTHFVDYISYKYQWVAVYIYFRDYLEKCEYVDFACQMMSDDWFGRLRDDKHKACSNEALGTYSCIILERNRNLWSANMNTATKDVSAKGIINIINRLNDLELYGKDVSFLL